VPFAAALTTETVARIVLVTQFNRAVSGLARIVGTVQHITAVLASPHPNFLRQRVVYPFQ
jgi:hypothetical protein